MRGYTSEIKNFVNILLERVKGYYGDRLVSFVIFGSVARNVFRPDSDIDCLIVTENAPRGRMKRVSEFQSNVEDALTAEIDSLYEKGIFPCISPVFTTRDEVKNGSPLFLDMTDHSLILFDREDFFHKYLDGLKERLDSLGSKRIVRGSAWYWVLKPDYKYGDVIEI